MRILVHDHCGHAFPVQLSRELARRGHDVLHLHCTNFVTGKGALERLPGDPPTLELEGVDLGENFEKYSFFRRMRQERDYGARFVARAERFRPEVVISGNTPLLSQDRILRWCEAKRIPSVHWLQDVISRAMRRAARGRLPVLGDFLGRSFDLLERGIVRRAGAVVAISEDFRPTLARWGVPPGAVRVIPNWAPLDELPPRPRRNAWSQRHGLDDKLVFLYSGTLGIKHNPDLLLQLALRWRGSDVVVVVISEGRGEAWLAQQKRAHGADNLLLLPYQSWEEMPLVLATGDVLVAILEPEAGAFSVPSKVLSYHCAGRPLLLAVPAQNLASRIVEQSGSGLVVDPRDTAGFLAAAERFVREPELRASAGARARAYAEHTFDIARIGAEFDALFRALRSSRG